MNIKKVLFEAGLLCWCTSSCHISFCMELSDIPQLIRDQSVYIASENVEGRVDNGQIPGFRILKENKVVSPISTIWLDKGMIRKIVNIIYNDEYCPANDEFHPGNDTFFFDGAG